VKRIVVGWSYENTALYIRLKEWSHKDTKFVVSDYYQHLRSVPLDIEVWVIGPEWKYSLADWHDILDVLAMANHPYHYGDTDWLLGVER
jgi:hypothetical protein